MKDKINLLPCPFCGKTVRVCVHDDEGNFHGELGCSYESDPWSGLSYAIHHNGEWGDCFINCDNTAAGGILFDTVEDAIEAWNERA